MKFIPNGVSSKVGMAVLKTQKHSPTLLFAAGIAGVVATAVLASRATLKLNEILDEVDEYKDQIESAVETRDDYDSEDAVKDKALVYFRAGVKIVKLYALPLAVAAVSVAALTGSHHILSKRNAALTAAYATIEKGFREYRSRVVEDQGADKDREYLHGVEKTKSVVVDENGKKTQVEKKTFKGVSPYGVWFDRTNPNWNHNLDYSIFFLKCQQNYLNDLLKSRGWLTLNEVYKTLGFEPTQAGMIVGWVLGNGDNYVDFGIWESEDLDRVHDFVRGASDELSLDFNVDGNIFDLVK